MTQTPGTEKPPRPRPVLRVGITGKRAIADKAEVDIRASLDSIVAALGKLLVDCRNANANFFSNEVPRLRIICGMAEGADQIAAKLAADRFDSDANAGTYDFETRLAAILPFAQEEFEKDFDKDPNQDTQRSPQQARDMVARFRELLVRPALEAKLEIVDEQVLASGDPHDRDLAYANLRDALIEHSDVLVAISDDVFGGSGGTVDVVRTAVQTGIPVIKIALADAAIHMMRAAEPDDPDQEPKQATAMVRGEPLPRDLSDQIARSLVPHDSTHEAEGASHGGHSRGVQARLGHYLGESFEGVPRAWLFTAVRDALVEWPRQPAREPGLFSLLRGLARRVPRFFQAIRVAVVKFLATKESFAIETPERKFAGLQQAWQKPETAIPQAPHFGEVLARRHAWADALAVLYANRTRGSYIAIAFYGAMAVLIGLLSVIFIDDKWTPVKIVILVAEGGLLFWAGWRLFRPAHDNSWHERMVEYRVLAELLRHQRYIYAFGSAERLDHLVRERGGDAWVGWYVRATLREVGFPTARLDAAYRIETAQAFRREELKEQISYNERQADRFNLIDDRLAWVIQWTWIVIAAVAILGALGLAILHFGYPDAGWAKVSLHVLKPLMTIAMAFTPAAIAALHGVRFQMEFRSTAERAEATHKGLQRVDKELQGYLARRPQPGRKRCVFLVREANEAMESDVSGWATVYKSKAAEPPG